MKLREKWSDAASFFPTLLFLQLEAEFLVIVLRQVRSGEHVFRIT